MESLAAQCQYLKRNYNNQYILPFLGMMTKREIFILGLLACILSIIGFYADDDVLYINTWVGCNWDVFCKHGGINMHTLYEQWEGIVETINETFGTDIKLREEKESYLRFKKQI